jgi:hypothetical protein
MQTLAGVSPLPPKKPKAKPNNVTESVYGPKALWDRLGEIAAADDRSKSDLIVSVLEEWLAKIDAEQSSKRE